MFVRVPPYESGVKLTNFVFSWQDGDFFWGKKCCTLFHTENEELSKKIGTCICIHTLVIRKYVTGGSNLRESRFSRILENYFAISLLDLDLEAF